MPTVVEFSACVDVRRVNGQSIDVPAEGPEDDGAAPSAVGITDRVGLPPRHTSFMGEAVAQRMRLNGRAIDTSLSEDALQVSVGVEPRTNRLRVCCSGGCSVELDWCGRPQVAKNGPVFTRTSGRNCPLLSGQRAAPAGEIRSASRRFFRKNGGVDGARA